jgi:TonB-dependent SusC/RagA subfamily outer membrane receptor
MALIIWGNDAQTIALSYPQSFISRFEEGVVKDASGEPIIGATVRVVGTKIATVTDLDGNFKIKAKSGQSLQFTYVGCKPKIVKVGRGSIAVTLEDDSQVLKDVQVVAYGVQKKVTVTGAISNINGSELTKVPTGSINNMLSGVVPGLSSVQYSGEPGADAATILVRGQATTNNSSPLIQVDGVERDFNDIDPSEIESITVLKDASATAVFGVRGANGVILVTTKRGKEGKAKISANTSMSVIVPTDPIKLANAYEYASYYNMQKLNDGAATAPFSDEILQKFKDHSDPLRFPDTEMAEHIEVAGSNDALSLSLQAALLALLHIRSIIYVLQENISSTYTLPYFLVGIAELSTIACLVST